MSDRRDIPVETSEGLRPGPSGGERILVVLAAVVLVGAVMIVGRNLLGDDRGVSVASASPSPSARPPATPFPTPVPREFTLVQESFPPVLPQPDYFGQWFRATVDLEVRAGASQSSATMGTLPAGALAHGGERASNDPELGWVRLDAPEPQGWVATRAGGEDLVERYVPPEVPFTGTLSALTAGDGGFVAIGSPSGSSPDYPISTLYVSTDGAQWHRASEPPGPEFYPGNVAFGPSGWLVVGYRSGLEGSELWISPDREHWTALGSFVEGYGEALVGSPVGYLLRIPTRGGFSSGSGLWFSPDGIHWSESRPDLSDYYQVTATPKGFYATRPPFCCAGEAPRDGAFSTDGLTWTHDLPNLLVAGVGDRLLGIDVASDADGPYALEKTFGRVRGGWRPIEGGNLPFIGAVVTALVSDGKRATAFGWELATEAPLSWTSDGGEWTRDRLPAAFGGLPSVAAAGDGVVVVAGGHPNSRGANPVIWHQRARGPWQEERSPVLGVAPDPSPDDCAAKPTDPIEFVNLDRGTAVACYGDAPLTVRLWSARCEGCYGEGPGTYQEQWLASPSGNFLYLSPVKSSDGWWGMAVLAPALGAPDPAWADAWLELTGHFDDPAATRCHWTPPPDQLPYYGGARSIIEGCRQQFVVTEVRVVEGP